jgi:hypothetical protein
MFLLKRTGLGVEEWLSFVMLRDFQIFGEFSGGLDRDFEKLEVAYPSCPLELSPNVNTR